MNKIKFEKIILYGGSFDPIHLGHIKTAELALKETNADLVIFIVTWLSPFKEMKFSSNKNRYQMTKLAIASNSKFIISNYEIKNKNSYFYKTVNYFKQKYPKAKLYSLIGSDNIEKFHLWKNAKQIANNTQIIYAKRPNFSIFNQQQKKNIKNFVMQCIGNTNLNISSTALRKKSNQKYLNPNVISYINNNLVYTNERIKNLLSDKRWKHCQRTAKFAKKLAYANHYDNPREAYIAGLFHDLAKEFSAKKLIHYAQKLGIKKYTSVDTLHSFAAYYLMKYDYLFTNEKILQAVYYHTEPVQKQISTLDKIIFVADKCEPGRIKQNINNLFNVKEMQKLALKNINQTFDLIYQKLKSYYESFKKSK